MQGDARTILAAQAVRALAYGFGSVLLGASLEARGFTPARAGLVLTAIVAGTALMSAAVGVTGDRVGRRRFYAILFFALAVSGGVLAFARSLWVFLVVALAGALSIDVIESGPFTSLEQAMLPAAVPPERRAHTFGTYNAIAAIAGSAGALLAGGPALLRRAIGTAAPDQRFFLALVPAGIVGVLLAASLSGVVEEERRLERGARALRRSRANVARLAGLFAADSLGGGFVTQSFVAYWLRARFDASLITLGVVFASVGLLQALSFLAAPRIAERIGLLNTMVFTHIPSNVFLAVIAFAPSLPVAIAFLLARQTLSQMDVPTRQAYVVTLVDPGERTAAAAYTNTARYLTRPLGPLLAGAAQQVWVGLPFAVGGGIKLAYDVVLYRWFRGVPVAEER